MIEEFTSKSWRDFSQRYRGTYGWYITESKKKILVRVAEVGENTVTFMDGNDFPYKGIADTGNVFEFIPVERGLYNLPSDLVLCHRKSERQWRRGLCRENTSIISQNTGRGLDITFELLSNLFNPQVPKEEYIQDFIDGERKYVAFDSIFGVTSRQDVVAFDRIIGKYSTKDKSITITEPLYSQEIRDIIRDLMLPITVIEGKK